MSDQNKNDSKYFGTEEELFGSYEYNNAENTLKYEFVGDSGLLRDENEENKQPDAEKKINTINDLPEEERKIIEKNYAKTKMAEYGRAVIPMLFSIGLVVGIILIITLNNSENDFYSNASVVTAKITDIRIERHSKSVGTGRSRTSTTSLVYYGNVEYYFHSQKYNNWVEVPYQSEAGGYVKIWVSDKDHDNIRPYKGNVSKSGNDAKTISIAVFMGGFALLCAGASIKEFKELKQNY